MRRVLKQVQRACTPETNVSSTDVSTRTNSLNEVAALLTRIDELIQ